MNTQECLLEELHQRENLTGSQKSLELYRSIFEGCALRDLPVMEDLELAWREYAECQNIIPDLVETRNRSSKDAIQSFTRCLDDGVIPPPETLYLINEALCRYLAANGDLSLDEGFFGRTHKRHLSYAFTYGANTRRMKVFSTFIAVSKLKDKRVSQVDIAEEFLTWSKGDDTDPETFLRRWRRWRQASAEWAE